MPNTLADPTPTRVSACPVHFLWDGRGKGRAFVRGGFLGLLGAGVSYSAGRTFGAPLLVDVGAWLALGAGMLWAAGQALTAAVARRS